jgi:hypothetical protein
VATYTGPSIVDYLKSIGEDSSYAARAKRAAEMGIENYKGTAAQNTQMLNMLRNPVQPVAPAQPAPVQPPIQTPELTPIQQTVAQTAPVVPEFKPPEIPVYTPNQDAQKALDDYNRWASQPYVSQYAPIIEEKVKEMLSRTFQYDPAKDTQFQLASKELTRNIMETMNARGILNSTVTENQIQQGIQQMLPQYQELARSRFMDEGQVLMSQVDMLMGLDETGYNRYMDEGQKKAKALEAVMQMDEIQYKRWKDAYEARYTEYKDKYNAEFNKIDVQRQKTQDAWNRVSELGYVDNQSAIILGVAPGTLSKEAREAKIRREQEIEDQKTALKNRLAEINAQYEKEKKIAELREETTTADPSKLGTAEQTEYYYSLLDIYMGGGTGTYANDPYKAYQWLTGPGRAQNIAMVGQKLYDRLVSDVANAMQMQKAYSTQPDTLKPTDYKTDPDFAEDYAYATSNKGEETLSLLIQRADEFIAKYGVDGYKALVAAAEE